MRPIAIATASGAHLEPAVAAARAGKHVIVEKPLEITLKRCDRIIAACDKAGVRLIGPNSLGIINTFANLNATFAESAPFRYEIAVVSQSGAMATLDADHEELARTRVVGDAEACLVLDHLATLPAPRPRSGASA